MSYTITRRAKNTRKPTARAAAAAATSYTPIPPMPPISSFSTAAAAADIKKPMRPLTAYHIFFQIEREWLIQTTAGPDADTSIHDKKSFIPDVPRRYRCIKLLPDWYAGPGKRQKRKHRKSHGKIGFLELSQLISKRWKNLATVDPETKAFVTKIAKRELAEYKVEMQEYKRLTEMAAAAAPLPPAQKTAQKPVVVVQPTMVAADTPSAMIISPSASPSPSPTSTPFTGYCMPVGVYAELIQSMDQDVSAVQQTSSRDEDEVDYSICSVSNNGNYIPSPSPASICSDDSICDPLFELEDDFMQTVKRCVSPVVSSSGTNPANVLADEHLLHLLSC